jgi:alpha-methylacyl-CoA racemase
MSQVGPLAGVRVVELAGIGPAQLGAMLLADLGAEVTRVDRAGTVPRQPPAERSRELLARGRRSLAVDLKAPEGVEIVWRLVERADVLIDPYRPGVTERLGLGPDVALERNPRLLYARMTGWGQDGPLASAAGHDLNYIALAGALHLIGEPDRPPPVPLNLIGDYGGGGMLLAFGVVAALFERQRSGLGQVIDMAMVDGVASLMTVIFQLEAQGLWEPERGSNWLQGATPWFRSYQTSDGRFVSVGALEPQFYSLLLERVGLAEEDWPQWDRDRWPALHTRLEQVFATRTLSEWCDELEGTDACFAPALRIDEVLTHPHLSARETYVEHDGAVQPAPVPRFGRTPGSIGRPPPWPGEHTAELAEELGVSGERIAALLEAGILAATEVSGDRA